MSDTAYIPVWLALIAALVAISGTAASITGAILGYLNSRDIQKTKEHVGLLEKNTNSMKDALVKVTGEKAFAEGVKQEQDKQNKEKE